MKDVSKKQRAAGGGQGIAAGVKDEWIIAHNLSASQPCFYLFKYCHGSYSLEFAPSIKYNEFR